MKEEIDKSQRAWVFKELLAGLLELGGVYSSMNFKEGRVTAAGERFTGEAVDRLLDLNM